MTYFSFELFNKSLCYLWFDNLFVRLLFSVCSSTDLWSEGREFESVRDIYIFFISMRNLIKIYFTYTTKHYEFRFFFRTVTLLCFLKWFTSIYINTPKCPILPYHLKFKKKMFKEYWYIHIGRSWKILYYWNSILFCENKIETNIRHALFLFSAKSQDYNKKF